MQYVATITREGKHWLAEFPDAPGCQTFAESEKGLRAMAQDALEGWLRAHLVSGDVPDRPRRRVLSFEGVGGTRRCVAVSRRSTPVGTPRRGTIAGRDREARRGEPAADREA